MAEVTMPRVIYETIKDKPINFQLAYLLAHQYAGAGGRDILTLLYSALEMFEEFDSKAKSGS